MSGERSPNRHVESFALRHDKAPGQELLGGPQAGMIVGSKTAIARIRKFLMKRALRMSKLLLAALEATLLLYLRPERLARYQPTLRMLTTAIRALAESLLPAVQAQQP